MTRIAQIGVGYWGPNLLRNLDQNKKCEVAAVVEMSEERRKYVKTNFPHIEVTDEIDRVLSDPSIDAVVIATPVKTHFEIGIKALQNGKHILVEKPMATTIEEIDALWAAAKAKNLVLMSGHTFLFNGAVRYVKKLIDDGELGDVRYIYSQRLNLGKIRSDVDALWNFAPHDISIIQYWLNDLNPSEIQRNGMDFMQTGIDDVVFLSIKYPNKIMANVHVSWLDPRKVRHITVVGSKKMVVYDDMAEHPIAIYDKNIDTHFDDKKGPMDYDKVPFSFVYRSGDVVMPKINMTEPLQTEISHFIDCIQTQIPCITGYEHTRNVVRILSGKR